MQDQYIKKQDGVHLSGFLMVELSGIQITDHLPSKVFSTIQIPNLFGIQFPIVFQSSKKT